MRYLRPLRLKQSYYKDVEKTIDRIFYAHCFEPIVLAFKDNGYKSALVQNANDSVSAALRKGKIFFFEGKFIGDFDAKISKEFRRLGAQYNARDKSYSFDVVPPSLQTTIAQVNLRMENIKSDILRNLDNSLNNRDFSQERIIEEYRKTVYNINQDFLQTIHGISIAPELTPAMQRNIAESWGENLEIYIKKWTDNNILKLRQEVATNTYAGGRSTNLIKGIQQDYGVSQRKAKFLARQETSLLMSNLREERYKDAGIIEYKWSGTMDERERPDHKLLEGTVQTWDKPPVTDRKTGKRANPGEDFGCRCLAIPIVR